MLMSLSQLKFERAFNIFDQKYQRGLFFNQMPSYYPSFNKHFSLSKHDKSKIDTKPSTKHTTKNIVYCIIEIRNLAGEFETHVEDSFLDGMYQNLSF